MPVSKGAKQKAKGKPEVQGLQGIGDLAPMLEMPGRGVQPPDPGSVPGVPGDGVGVDGRCVACDDTGMVAEMRGKDRLMSPCPCMARKRVDRIMLAAEIPAKFTRASLSTYQPQNPEQTAAKLRAQWFVERFIERRERNGLAFTGPVGTGKTHLSVGLLREVATRWGSSIRYVNMAGIAKAVQETFGGRGRSESEITGPAKTAELAVLDELGAQQWTEWRADLISEIIGARYDAGLATLVTTNLAFEMPGIRAVERSAEYGAVTIRAATLGDQIGARMMDRLREMCEPVTVLGQSWRGR